MEAAKTAVQLSLRRYQALQQQQHDVGSMPVTAAAPPSNTVAGAAAEYYHPAEHHHRPDTPQPSNAHGPHAGAAPDQPPPTLQAPGGAYQPAAATADAAELHAKAVRTQAATVVADLKLLRREVAEIGRRARKRRGRRWLVGGFVAAFIPLLRAFVDRWRAWRDETEESRWRLRMNETEYAFWESKSLAASLLHGARRYGSRIAAVVMFILGALYAFQNEVVLAAARTVMRRLKVLSKKVEEGNVELSDKDLDVLTGWRWRVIFWEQS